MSNGYDWSGAAEGSAQSEKIPAGKGIMLTVDRVVYGKKGGPAFKSKAGDPQIMVIFQDDQEREASQMITLSAKAGWVLARLLSRFGVDMEALKAEGLEPRHFANPTVCNTKLLGLSGLADVSYTTGTDGKDYADIEPCEPTQPHDHPAPENRKTSICGAKASPLGTQYEPIVEDDIPF